MQQTHHRSGMRRLTETLIFLVAATLAVVAVVHHTRPRPAPVAQPKTTKATSKPHSSFSFTGTSGWKQGATNKTSMALFRDTQDCFTSVEYKTGTVDAAAELQKSQTELAGSGYTVTPGSVQTFGLQTTIGQQQYQLHQYTVVGSGDGGTLEGGQEFGYLQLSAGYVRLEGYCDAASDLPATLPALQAIKFETS